MPKIEARLYNLGKIFGIDLIFIPKGSIILLIAL